MLKIVVFDSGIGGLSVLKELDKNLSGVEFIYYGDNENSPYGDCSILRLFQFVKHILDLFILEGVDCIVIACNTISCTLFRFCKAYVNVPIFGVFPPIESSIISGKRAVLLCTKNTAKTYFGYERYLKIVPLKGFVERIERYPYCLDEKVDENYFLDVFGDFDCIIYGCTHYFFRKIGINNHFRTTCNHSGVEYTVKHVKSFYKSKNRLNKPIINRFKFLGKNSTENEHVFYFMKNK
jgi:glutamate racemase